MKLKPNKKKNLWMVSYIVLKLCLGFNNALKSRGYIGHVWFKADVCEWMLVIWKFCICQFCHQWLRMPLQFWLCPRQNIWIEICCYVELWVEDEEMCQGPIRNSASLSSGLPPCSRIGIVMAIERVFVGRNIFCFIKKFTMMWNSCFHMYCMLPMCFQ